MGYLFIYLFIYIFICLFIVTKNQGMFGVKCLEDSILQCIAFGVFFFVVVFLCVCIFTAYFGISLISSIS